MGARKHWAPMKLPSRWVMANASLALGDTRKCGIATGEPAGRSGAQE